MERQTNYIVYLCYGNEGVLQECAYSLLSLSRLYKKEELADTQIWIYTDQPEFFKPFRDCGLPLHYRTIDMATVKQWRGAINFTHRVKIEMLKDLVKDKEGNVLYVDSDCVFTHRIDKVLEDIQAGALYMHVLEDTVSNRSNPILTKLDDHLKKNSTMQVNGKPIQDLAMWNAGVLGFNTKQKHLLDEVLTFTDEEYKKFPKHIVEQFAFSVYFQQTGDVKAAMPYILHYWNLKEARMILASFFSYFKNEPWDALTQYATLIQMPVLMQEKVNFLANKGMFGKKEWIPLSRNWEEQRKQL